MSPVISPECVCWPSPRPIQPPRSVRSSTQRHLIVDAQARDFGTVRYSVTHYSGLQQPLVESARLRQVSTGAHARSTPRTALSEALPDIATAAREGAQDRLNTYRPSGSSNAHQNRTSSIASTSNPDYKGTSRGGVPQQGSTQSSTSQQLVSSLLTAAAGQAAARLAGVGSWFGAAVTRLARGFEPPPPGFPPGPQGEALLEFLQDPLAYLERITARYGGAVGLVLGGERVVLLSDPDLARAVLIDQSACYIKDGTAFFPNSDLAGEGLLVSDGDVWRRQRRLSNPAFRRAAVDAYAQAMVSATQKMVRESWAGGGVREVYADYNDLTLQITMEALFGSDLAAAQGAKVTSAIKTAFEFFAKQAATGFLVPDWVPTPDNVQYGAAVQRLDAVVYGVIADRRRRLSTAASAPQDLLGNLMAAREEDGSGMDDRRLRDELMTLLVAGQETSAILLAWATAHLAACPATQRRAAAEVRSVLAGRTPTAADARQLPYLEAVVLESLRLSPPAYMVGRCAAQPTTLRSFRLPQGTTVLVTPYIMHRDPSRWDKPLDFRPERWLDSGPQQDGGGVGVLAALSGMGPNGAFIPFGAGPRNCIGTGFAMMESLLVLASVLQAFVIEPQPDEPFPKAEPRITLRPAKVDVKLVPVQH